MQDLERELQLLRKRLTRLEEALNLPPIQSSPMPTAAPAPTSTPTPAPRPLPTRVPAPRPEPRSEGRFLGVVAVICFVLAVIFLIQLAISSGWLTPARQLAIVFISGFALVGSALWTRERDAEYSGLLAAAGVIALYFGAYGGHLYFGLLDRIVTIVLVGGIALYNVYLYGRFSSNLFLVTAAAGVYLGPLLLGRFGGELGLVCGYNVIWSVVFSLIAIRIEARALCALAAYFAFGSIGLMSLSSGLDGPLANGDLWALLLAQTAQFAIFVTAIVRHTLLHRVPMSEPEAVTYFPVMLIFYASEYYLLSKLMPDGAPWISLVLGLLLVGVSVSTRQKLGGGDLPSTQLTAGFAALALFHSFYLEILGETARSFVFVLILAAAVFMRPGRFKGPWFPAKVALLAILGIEGQKLFFRMLGTPEPHQILVAILSATFLLCWPVLRRDGDDEASDNWYLAMGAGHVLAMQSLYQLLSSTGSVAVSIGWGLYALGVLVFGFQRRDLQFARSAAIILLFATAKVFLYDLSSATAVVRIVCLAITGVVLYLSGFLFRRIAELRR